MKDATGLLDLLKNGGGEYSQNKEKTVKGSKNPGPERGTEKIKSEKGAP